MFLISGWTRVGKMRRTKNDPRFVNEGAPLIDVVLDVVKKARKTIQRASRTVYLAFDDSECDKLQAWLKVITGERQLIRDQGMGHRSDVGLDIVVNHFLTPALQEVMPKANFSFAPVSEDGTLRSDQKWYQSIWIMKMSM